MNVIFEGQCGHSMINAILIKFFLVFLLCAMSCVPYHVPHYIFNIMHNYCVFAVFAAFKCVPLLCAFVRLIVCGEASLD